jgi:hypothetical protein
MQLRWMEGGAAMSMRSTRGCGSLGAENHAWEVLRLGGLTVEETADRQLAKDVDRKKRAAETRRRRKTDPA